MVFVKVALIMRTASMMPEIFGFPGPPWLISLFNM